MTLALPDGQMDRVEPSSRRGWILLGSGLVLLVAAGLAGLLLSQSGEPAVGASSSTPPPALATISERSLVSQIRATGTLGYQSDYQVTVSRGAVPGTFTWLPDPGQVVTQGHRLYAIDGAPTILLYGDVPAYRALSEGISGDDVRQLNAALASLYPNASGLDSDSSEYTAATAAAMARLQKANGLPETGTPALGEVAFLPGPARVTNVAGRLGGPAQPGMAVLEATSTTRIVICQLDAGQQSKVKEGDEVFVTLPDQTTTGGTVGSVASVATGRTSSSASGAPGGGSDTTPTVEVQVTLSDPAAAGNLDQAPVTVAITTATVEHALVVPVDALLAQTGSDYAVEVIEPDGSHHLVPVSLGMFDDAGGLVQISGSGISAGLRVVVPTI